VVNFTPIGADYNGSKSVIIFMIDALFQKHPHSGILTIIDEQTLVKKRIFIQITITANTNTIVDIKTPDNPYDFNIISNSSSYIMGDLHNPGVIDDTPIIAFGLKDTFLLQILQNLEGRDFCEYGIFKNICKKLQDKISSIGNKNSKPFAIFPEEPSRRADSPNEHPIIDGKITLKYNISQFITVFYGELLDIIKKRSILSVVDDIQPFYILANKMNFFSFDDDANLYMPNTEKQTTHFLNNSDLLIHLSDDIIGLMPQTQYFLLYHSTSRNLSEFKLNLTDEDKKDLCIVILEWVNSFYNSHKPFRTLEEFLEKTPKDFYITYYLPETVANPIKAKTIKAFDGNNTIAHIDAELAPESGKNMCKYTRNQKNPCKYTRIRKKPCK
jgi:hypothetical protein